MRLVPFIRTVVALWASVQTVLSLNTAVRFKDTEWDDDNWTIHTRLVDQGRFQSRMSLANGYMGITLAALGPFFEVDAPVSDDALDGWPLYTVRQTFATIAGFYNNQGRSIGANAPWLYQYGGEGFISGVPHWSGLLVEANGAMLSASVSLKDVSNFTSSLDVGNGIMRWEFTWKPGGGETIHVEYTMFVHKLHVNQAAVHLRLTASHNINVTVYDVLEGACAVRTDFVDKKFETGSPTIWSAVSPINVPNVTAYIYSTLNGNEFVDLGTRTEVTTGVFANKNQSSIAQSVNVHLLAGKTAEIGKHIGAASSDAFFDPKSVARGASIKGASAGFPTLLRSHITEWGSILTKDSVDSYYLPNGSLPSNSYVRELHITSATNPFMILQNTVGPNAIAAAGNNINLNIHSIPVCGLGSDCYGGLIFWDADIWMAPGLQVSHPQHVETIVNYRIGKYGQAKENIKAAFTSSKNQTGRFTGGAVYPWTSARYGNCTGTGPCFDYEYHINGEIAIAFRNYFAVTGNAQYFKEKMLPISNDIAYFFGEILDFNKTSGFYELWNATDPDEYANNINQPGFTTALILNHFKETNDFNAMFGQPQNETWKEMSSKMPLPVNEDVGIVLEYQTMNGSAPVKQADVVLVDDMLHYQSPYSLSTLDYYANKQSPDGPGMTYAAFSIVANEISPSGCSSYTYGIYSSQPYARAPWFQFSEQLLDSSFLNGGTHPAYPFLTGMGGANRVGIFGYLGLRLFVDKLDIDPSLPPQISHLNYRTFYWQGYAINATSNSTHTTLMRLPNQTLPTANPAFRSNPIPVTLGTRNGTYSLSLTGPLIIENRMLGQNLTTPGNLLQCKPVVPNADPHMPGQYPFAAIDGASSTRWQPSNAHTTSYLSVDLGQNTTSRLVTDLHFDWGEEPPVSFEVFFSNHSLPPFTGAEADVRSISAGNVSINRPFNESNVAEIRPVEYNRTMLSLKEPMWSARYVHLGIRGNWAAENETIGGTVAEWSLVARDGY